VNDHLDMRRVDGVVWRVRARIQESEEAAGERYTQLVEQYLLAHGEFSVWRITDLKRSKWLIVACGLPEKVDPLDLGGGPGKLSPDEAAMFCGRRLRVAIDAADENPLAEEFSQVAHYEQGAVIAPDGSIWEVAS
jgi:hypothetical protein